MLLSAVSVLVVAQSSSEIPEGLMNNPVYLIICHVQTIIHIRRAEQTACECYNILFKVLVLHS